MTTAAASAAGQPGRRRATAMWLGHYASELYLFSMALQGVAVAVGTPELPGALRWLAAAVTFPLIMLSVVALILQREVHDRNLCLRDLARAPLADPEGEVQRRMWWLRRYHGRRAVLMMSTPVLFLVVMAAALTLGSAGEVVQTAAVLAFVALAAFNMQVDRVHRRLRPWCPCAAGGRGDDGPQEPSPVTPPANAHTRTS